MYQYDVEMFMGACQRKGLAMRTMTSYEQTLRLLGLYLGERKIERTEDINSLCTEPGRCHRGSRYGVSEDY